MPVESQMSTWIGSSFISVFLLFMGGILIGHLLWYRDRSGDLQAVKEAETKYNRAKTAARNRKRKFILLSRDAKSHELKSTEYRKEADSLRKTLTAQADRADSLQVELGKLHAEQSRYELASQNAEQQRDAAEQRVQEAATECSRLQTSLQETESQLAQASATTQEHVAAAATANAELDQQRERGDELAARNETLQSEVAHLASQRDQLTQQCDELTRQRDQFASERAEVATERDNVTAQRDELTTEREQLVSEQGEIASQRDSLADQRDALVGERDSLVRERDTLVREHDALADERDGLLAERDTLSSERDRAVSERDQLARERAEVSEQVGQNDERYVALQKEYAALRDQHAAAIQINRDQTLRFDSHQADFERLEKAFNESTVEVQTLQSEHDELLEQLDERTARIQAAIDGRVTAETALSEMEGRTDSLLTELAEANHFRVQHEAKLAEVELLSGDMQSQAQQLRGEIDAKEQRIVELESQVVAQDQAIEQHRAEAERLSVDGPELQKLQEALCEKSAALAEAETELQSIRDVAAALHSEVENRDRQIESLLDDQRQIQSQLADQGSVIDRLEGELRTAAAHFVAAEKYQSQATEFQARAAAMQDKALAMQAHSEDLQNQLHSVSGELDASLDANAAMQQRLRQIEVQLHENVIAMRDLRRKRANVPNLNAIAPGEQDKAA